MLCQNLTGLKPNLVFPKEKLGEADKLLFGQLNVTWWSYAGWTVPSHIRKAQLASASPEHMWRRRSNSKIDLSTRQRVKVERYKNSQQIETTVPRRASPITRLGSTQSSNTSVEDFARYCSVPQIAVLFYSICFCFLIIYMLHAFYFFTAIWCCEIAIQIRTYLRKFNGSTKLTELGN